MSTQTGTKVGSWLLGAFFIIGGVFTEPREPAAATGLYTIGTILLGVALALSVIDWYRSHRNNDSPPSGGES